MLEGSFPVCVVELALDVDVSVAAAAEGEGRLEVGPLQLLEPAQGSRAVPRGDSSTIVQSLVGIEGLSLENCTPI